MSVRARLFALDLRSLALFRVGLGLALLLDAITRAVDARAFLSDDGVLPRTTWFRVTDWDVWSLHVATGSVEGAHVLLLLGGALAVAVVVGWRTRTVCVLSLVLLVSLQNRTLAVSYGFDLLLRVSLLWACFLPLGARFALDARGRSTSTRERKSVALHLSAGTVALTLQMVLVYVCSGLQKLQDPSWRTLDAVFLGLTTDNHATSFARDLAQHVDVTRGLSALVLALELLVPLLLLAPIAGRARDAMRLFVVAAFVLFHLGTGVFFALGLFPLMGIVAWLPFLPTRLWTPPPGSPAPLAVTGGRLESALVGALIVVVLAVNVESLVNQPVMHPALRRVTTLLRLDQTWNMFERPMNDGWFVLRAQRDDGQIVDVMRSGAPVTLEKPASVSSTFSSMRWRKYMTSLARPTSSRNRRSLLRYACSWNAGRPPGEHIKDVELLMVAEIESPDHAPMTTTRSLASRECR